MAQLCAEIQHVHKQQLPSSVISKRIPYCLFLCSRYTCYAVKRQTTRVTLNFFHIIRFNSEQSVELPFSSESNVSPKNWQSIESLLTETKK